MFYGETMEPHTHAGGGHKGLSWIFVALMEAAGISASFSLCLTEAEEITRRETAKNTVAVLAAKS